ncbi:MAG: glutaredoxin family protein [Aquiluna sp.]
MAQIHLTLITRQGCHLCEVAEGELARVVAAFSELNPDKPYTVELLDVDSAEDLKVQYSEEVPVLILNGEQIAFFQIDADRVLKRLEQI